MPEDNKTLLSFTIDVFINTDDFVTMCDRADAVSDRIQDAIISATLDVNTGADAHMKYVMAQGPRLSDENGRSRVRPDQTYKRSREWTN